MKSVVFYFLVACVSLGSLVAPVASQTPASRADSERLPRVARLARVPAGPVQADLDGNRLFDDLEAELAVARADQALDVIVRYKPGREPVRLAAVRPGTRRLVLDGSLALRLTPPEVRRLALSDDVESIEADMLCHVARDTAERYYGTTKASADFGLSGDGDGDRAHYSARDHTIAILDTGIDGAHQDFRAGKIIAWQDFVNKRTAPYDDEGHGTHVASIVAGAVNAAGVGGVAPAAALVGVKTLSAEGEGAISQIAQAVEWCISNKNRYGIQVINLSATTSESGNGTDALSRTLNRAVDAGIVVCVAAGNDGPNLRTVGTPAAAAKAITVGNIADPGEGGFFLDPYSSRGPTADGRVKPDVCAPGYQILAAKAGTKDGYIRQSGTSMSAPFVAGVAALILQANPSLAPGDVKAILKETAVHYGPEGENNDFGAGRMDGYAAIAKAASKADAGPALPSHLEASGRLSSSVTVQNWQLTVSDTQWPIAVSLIMQSAGADFDLGIYDPSGRLVRRSATDSREEVTAFRPSTTGTYTIAIVRYAGSGEYSLDLSAGSNKPLKEGD
jgi:serine protease AprX